MNAGRVSHAGKEREISPLTGLRDWLFADRTRIAFTAVTLIAMLAGLLVETTAGMGPAALWIYAAAYLAGGVYGVMAGLRALRQKRIDVDILMVLACAADRDGLRGAWASWWPPRRAPS